MARFEQRAAERHPPVAPEEVAKTYREVSTLLADKPDAPVSAEDRVKLAEQVVRQAAVPTSIDQGGNSTCNVTVVEAVAYTKSPAEAAKLVADVATTGQFTSPDGKVYPVEKKNLVPDSEAQKNPPEDGKR